MAMKKVTDKMQRVAVDILQEIELWWMSLKEEPSKSEQKVINIYNRMCERYELRDDPFTHMCCTTKDWIKNNLEYDKQSTTEKYDHCDELD